jgi:TPR repeat protein
MNFFNKYLKYKQKYLTLKKQVGGVITCQEIFKNVLGTCWAISEQMILTSGQATSNDLEVVMKSFTKETKNNFVKKRIQQVQSDPILSKFFPGYIFGHLKIDYLRNILDKFIDRYYSKFFKLRNPQRPEETYDPELNLSNKGRCELVISNNFRKLFDFDILKFISKMSHGGSIHQYLFINLLAIFFLGYTISFINYFNNFNEINFNVENDLGIILETNDHTCCLFICNESEKYYNDNDKQIYDCDWRKILQSTSINNLYIEKGSCLKQIDDIKSYPEDKKFLSKVLHLTVLSKHTQDNIFDIDIKKILNLTNLDTIRDFLLQTLLGKLYYNGIGVSQNYTDAFKYFKLAADQGYSVAECSVGLMYYHEKGVKLNYEEAFKYFKLAADKGYANAQYFIGIMYYYGQGTKQDFTNAYKYLKLVVDQNNIDKEQYTEAQYMVGLMYYYGHGIDKNQLAALLLFRNAAEKSHTNAQYMVGFMYYYGHRVSKSYMNAFTNFESAAVKNHTDAQYMVGFMYYYGQHVSQSYKDAFHYLKLAADKDHTEAQYMLGIMYYNGQHVSQSYEDSLSYLKLAADKDHTEAQYMLGIMYYNGLGIAPNFTSAFKYFRGFKYFKLAADKDHTKAQYMVGYMYYYGQHVSQSYEDAFHYFKLSADKDHTEAQYMVGYMYEIGQGISQSYTNALIYFRLAADKNHQHALIKLSS